MRRVFSRHCGTSAKEAKCSVFIVTVNQAYLRSVSRVSLTSTSIIFNNIVVVRLLEIHFGVMGIFYTP